MNPQAIAAAISRARLLDLTAPTLQALCTLSADGPCSLSHLSFELDVSTAAVTHIADRLESLRYAARTANPKDRRGITLTITAHGREALADIIRDATAASWKNLTPAH